MKVHRFVYNEKENKESFRNFFLCSASTSAYAAVVHFMVAKLTTNDNWSLHTQVQLKPETFVFPDSKFAQTRVHISKT